MKFKKEILLDMINDEVEPEGFKIIKDEMYGTSRWSIEHQLVFKHEEKFYCICYRTPATEIQCESPLEYEDDEVECQELVEVEKIVKDYITKESSEEESKRR